MGEDNRAAAFAERWDVPLRAVQSGPGALAALPAVLDGLVHGLGPGGLVPDRPAAELALVVDGIPKAYHEGDVEAVVRRLLPAGIATRTVTAVAGEHGWPIGVIDATPIRHLKPVAAAYPRDAAIAEAEAFLDGRAYVTREQAAEVLAEYR